MPRPNQPRSIASEQALARRIAHERERRSWSYDGLASRMTKAGCSINASAIYKIEKSDPPRRITVDELVGFSQVFGVAVNELLLPPEVADREALAELLVQWEAARSRAAAARVEEEEAWTALHTFTTDNDVEPLLEKALSGWVEHYFEPKDREAVKAAKMVQLTGSEKWLAVWRAETENA